MSCTYCIYLKQSFSSWHGIFHYTMYLNCFLDPPRSLFPSGGMAFEVCSLQILCSTLGWDRRRYSSISRCGTMLHTEWETNQLLQRCLQSIQRSDCEMHSLHSMYKRTMAKTSKWSNRHFSNMDKAISGIKIVATLIDGNQHKCGSPERDWNFNPYTTATNNIGQKYNGP